MDARYALLSVDSTLMQERCMHDGSIRSNSSNLKSSFSGVYPQIKGEG